MPTRAKVSLAFTVFTLLLLMAMLPGNRNVRVAKMYHLGHRPTGGSLFFLQAERFVFFVYSLIHFVAVRSLGRLKKE